MKIKAHTICPGYGEGEAIVYNGSFSFLGDLNFDTGEISLAGHELQGVALTNKVFIFSHGSGSSGGPRFAWMAKRNKVAPNAMICLVSEPVLSCGVIAAKIPTVDKPEADLFSCVKTGDYVKVNAKEGIIEVEKV